MVKKRILHTLLVPVSVVVVLTALCWWGYSRLSFQEEQADTDLYALVPADCEALLETKDINTLHKTVYNSHFIAQYDRLNVSKLLRLLTDNLETLSQHQAHGLSTEMNRQLLVSFHHPGSVDDQIIYGRFGNGDIGSITHLMQEGLGSIHPPKSLTYKGEEIIIYPLGKDFLACYFQPGFFAVSFQVKLIEKVIDAFKEGASLGNCADFNAVPGQTKHNELLSLYLPPQEEGKSWKHYEIRMNASAIYLTGSQAMTDSADNRTAAHPLLERTDGDRLPRHIQMMVQKSLGSPMATETPTLAGTLADHGCREVTALLFSPAHADTAHCQLLMIPVPTERLEELKSAMRHPLRAKRRTSIWTQGRACPVWQCEADSLLTTCFIRPSSTGECWVSLYNDLLLTAADRMTLEAYLAEADGQAPDTPTNQEAYQICLGDLAEQANCTLVADMNDIISNHPAIAEDNPMIPRFFFKHKDFFKHFMFATQQINHGGQMNIQLILTYQGDSLLFKR